MTEKKWKSGDVVRLKSGGPIMTVDRYVPCFEPAYDGETPPMSALSSCGGSMKQNGESVRVLWFPETPPGVAGQFHISFHDVHEDALTVVQP